jgi:hypothetical protein
MLVFLIRTSQSGIDVAVGCNKVQRHILKNLSVFLWDFPISELLEGNDTYLGRDPSFQIPFSNNGM